MLPVKPKNVPSDGNREVVAMLRKWLERAEQGDLAFAVIIACENPIHVVSNHAGTMRLAFAANWGLDTAKLRIMEEMHSRHSVPFKPDNSAGADRVCYNMSKAPACYDFISWLVLAEMNRRRSGADGPLKVGFSMVDTPEERDRHEKLRKKMYEGVIFPALPFVGAVADPLSANAPEMDRYTFSPVVELAKAGEDVPLLTPSKEGMKAISDYLKGGQAPVTITLREADYTEYRNSNLPEWLKAAKHLKDRGERVIFIRDTAKALEPIKGFETCPAAAIDLDTRLALYEQAKCNLFVSNGPWTLALFGRRPWLMFVEVSSLSPFFPETPQFWTQWHGIDPLANEQAPWSRPNQRIIWKRDNAEHIIEAWEALKLDELPQAAE